MKDKNSPEFLDQFFAELDSSSSTADFSRRLKKQMEETLHDEGYESWDDLMSRKKGPSSGDGFAYVKRELAKVRYDMRHSGPFKDGHQDALEQYWNRMCERPKEIQLLRPDIEADLKQHATRRGRRDRYIEGYVAGLNDLLAILKGAREPAMRKVKEAVAK